ncbi:MAG: single-stranded-DNA-specific exonuclease RecJ [Candidatus Bostrichicola ureolyticus]|nr:MAG: single-stranded-DNA-specific exonuclease RecJ [Candidatus Bostrichicola ureolyticus]
MQWIYKDTPKEEIISKLKLDLGVNHIIAILLAQRNIKSFEEAKNFFRPKLEYLYNPFLMKDMNKAVNRILKAIKNNENILIYGDYDVDGITSVVMIYDFLKKLSNSFIYYYIPDRYKEGYGISYEGINFALSKQITLIIALDCGINNLSEINYAKKHGIDFIICDHHLPEIKNTNAYAVLNPKYNDCKYPFKELSGCGIGFKLIHGLANILNINKENVYLYLDLVTLSIAADVVPVINENRIISFYGIKKLNTNPFRGIRIIVKKIKKTIDMYDIVYKIAPKINAAGRIKHANIAVELLLSKKTEEIKKLYKEIIELNNSRKNIDSMVTKEALELIKLHKEENKYTTIVYKPNWHKGVLGIVASRLIEKYYRPTLIFTATNNGKKLVASARSVIGFDIYNAIKKCSKYIDYFGGHKYAAGMTIDYSVFPIFKSIFENIVKNSINEKQRNPSIIIDYCISLNDITQKLLRILKQFSPFGQENGKPVFLSKEVLDKGCAKVIGNNHLKLNVYHIGQKKSLIAIGFGLGKYIDFVKNNRSFDIVYTIEEISYKGKNYTQLYIKDIRGTERIRTVV